MRRPRCRSTGKWRIGGVLRGIRGQHDGRRRLARRGGGVHRQGPDDDPLGSVFGDDIRAAGVEFDSDPATGGPPTGRCLVLVTPDAQRTMQTFLGASATLAPEDLIPRGSAMPGSPTSRGTCGTRRRPGRRSSARRRWPTPPDGRWRSACRTRSASSGIRDEFRDLLERPRGHPVRQRDGDPLAVRDRHDRRRARCAPRATGGLAAITRGAAGSVVLRDGKVWTIDAAPVDRVVDTTGAGDLFASGFLHGVTRGLDPARCGRLGGIAAAEIIGHFGARPEASARRPRRGVLERIDRPERPAGREGSPRARFARWFP